MIADLLILSLFGGSLLAGFVGALSGLGGGMIIVPLMVLGLHIDIHYAIGTSLIAVIATSSGASAAYLKEGYTNIRAGIFLETATTIGAVAGVYVGSLLPTPLISVIFGLVLLYCAFATFFSKGAAPLLQTKDALATFFKLDSDYPTLEGTKTYHVKNVPVGYMIMLFAGLLSAILGIGSGAVKVLALDRAMHFPFKVSTTTSNFMIGVTAATSAGIYLHLGYIDPILTMPIVIGVLIGSFIGARLLPFIKTKTLNYLFTGLIVLIGSQMIYKAIVGAL